MKILKTFPTDDGFYMPAEFSEHLLLTEQTKKKIAMPMLSPRGFEAVTAEHWLSLH